LERIERRRRQADTKILLLGKLFRPNSSCLIPGILYYRASRIWKIHYTQELSTPFCSQVILFRDRGMESSHSSQPRTVRELCSRPARGTTN
jgi:hypothetical protein